MSFYVAVVQRWKRAPGVEAGLVGTVVDLLRTVEMASVFTEVIIVDVVKD